MAQISVRLKLSLLIGVFATGVVISGLFLFLTMSQVKVNGPVYRGIVQQKDLLADILPPPAYLIESYLVTHQMLSLGADSAGLPALVEKSRVLAKEFEERHEFWRKKLVGGEIKNLLVESAYKPGREFLDLQQGQLIPALQQGNAQAAGMAKTRLDQAYAEHRASIDALVVKASAQSAAEEAQAAELIAVRSVLSIVLFAGVLLIGAAVSWWIIRSLVRQLGGEPDMTAEIANKIAVGKLLDAIVPNIQKTSDLVQEIAVASQVQSAGAGELNVVMGQLGSITQQNASSSEELAATAEEMSSQAAKLQELISFFKVAATQAPGRGVARTASPASSRATPEKGNGLARPIIVPDTKGHADFVPF